MTDFTQPTLTSIGHPSYELGRMAAGYAVMLRDGSDHSPAHLKFAPTLVRRESTGFFENQTEG